MKKDKEWLKNQIYNLSSTVMNIDGNIQYVVSKIAVLDLIDQLEIPELNVSNPAKNTPAWLLKDNYTIEPEIKYILKNKRGFVSAIQVKQSHNYFTSNINISYTPHQQDAYKFSLKEKEFYKDSFSLEEDEVINK